MPAPFRAVLAEEAADGVALLTPLSDAQCLEGSGLRRIERLAGALEEMSPVSEERDALATAILAGVHHAKFDAEGRIVLPEELLDAAELEGEALFAGLGDKFQIWRPERFETWRAEARALARKKADRLPWSGAKTAGEKAGPRSAGHEGDA